VGVPPLEFNLDAESTQRYAIVVGNGNYEHVDDLPNAVADAKAVANLLRNGGYTVADYYDVTKVEFEAALRRMLFEVEPGAELFVFFAGHGVQIGAQNFLLPSDTKVSTVYDIPFSTVSLASLMSLASSRARSLVAVLDACRNNPFPGQAGVHQLDGTPAELRTGFSAQDTPINSLVVFSTSPGAVALDGVGENSPFTTALIEASAERPNVPFNDVLKDIRRKVYSMTGRRQVPWESSSLIEPVYLSRSVALVEETEPAPISTAPAQPVTVKVALNRTVPIGKTLREQFGVSEETSISLTKIPNGGRIEVEEEGKSTSLSGEATQAIKSIEKMTYKPFGTQKFAKDLDQNTSLSDSFQVAVNDTVSDVTVSLEIDPCDFQAGDHLDPEGVGITRFPNEIEPEIALEACQKAVAQNPENGRFFYQLGRVQLALRDVDGASQSFETANRLGHTRAIYGQGQVEVAKVAQTAGVNAGRAPDSALAFYAKGVERGDPYAYHSLGRQFLLYPQSGAEMRQGFDLLSRSLELGHTFSMNALGLYFLDEKARHYDVDRGLRYLRESAARDDIYGYANMGFVHARGIGGTPKDPQKAFDLYKKASDGGHPTAPSSIGRMYNAGSLPGGKDFNKAVEWYDISLSRGDAWGGANAAWVIANQTPAGYTIYDAVIRAAKASALGNPKPSESAAKLLTKLGKEPIAGGTQLLMKELGVEIEVDGAFGGGSLKKLNAFGVENGIKFSKDPTKRLEQLAKIFWERSKFRVDLY
jgi:TPR repeat protein